MRKFFLCCFALSVIVSHTTQARAGSEDDCIDAQEKLKMAKNEAEMAASEYASCLSSHDSSDDCSSEKSQVDDAQEEVETAQMEASGDCS